MRSPTLLSCLLLAFVHLLPVSAADKAADKWVEQKIGKLSEERQADGDSFAFEIEGSTGKTVLRSFRLYGVDSPESDAGDKVLSKRITEQAEHFGVDPKQVPKFGKEAARFTERLLKRGKVRLLTRGKLGQKTEKHPGRPQRYYAMIEVEGPDGKRRWLHELLLENGFARAYGKPAPWPMQEEDRHGEKAACDEFEKTNERLEKAAKRNKAGIWGASGGGR
jgi:endonuclease YncB( thermonuclease family)